MNEQFVWAVVGQMFVAVLAVIGAMTLVGIIKKGLDL
jgi:hypothetical protein